MSNLTLRNIKKYYDKTPTIEDLSLDINSGEFLVLVGPSGCGKSTLLRMIAGLEDITSGTVSIGGKDVTELPAGSRGLSMVFQSYALYPHMSVRENLEFGLKNIKTPAEEIKKRVANASKILQLDTMLERLPQNLSGGQRQRVAIGRSIVQQPKVFLFDEPLSNLDASLRVQMRQEISQLHEKLDTTMIYVTHDQVEAMTLADRIVVLNKGNIEQVGTPIELYNSPKNIFVAEFIGTPTINIIPAQYSKGGVISIAGQAPIQLKQEHAALSDGEQLFIGLRPEHLRLNEENDFTLTADATLSELQGDSTLIYADLSEASVNVKLKSSKQLKYRKGDPLTIGFNESNILIFNEAGDAV
ncbi:ABC transporter ATP-binding protein [Psychromonas ossibalaenae]|uniref:ABC transporter ATP-binding protein n=1 Tax=Psychromonas ossibalaenae TaxID=444922 RepID=UPI0003618A49|nr:sn-glycerol-3-phosphate ABC transporter ATP-binding protein UgpC [Psychromonas ossibalaenae]